MIVEYNKVGNNAIEKLEIDNGVITQTRKFDVSEELDYIQTLKDNAVGKDMIHVASIPLEVINLWRVRDGFDWFTASQSARAQKLNDPDNKMFRVWEGQV